MASLIEELTKQLSGNTLKSIASQVGADENRTQTAVAAALPTLLGALARNSAKSEGAEALHRAVAKDHDGSILDQLSSFIGNPQAGPGEGILKHVLGARRPVVEQGLSKTSGLDAGSIGKILTTLAPIVMGAIGKQQRQQGLNASSLAGLLGQEVKETQRRAPQEMGLVNQLLDSDGDGDVDAADLAKKGMGLLGKLFGRR